MSRPSRSRAFLAVVVAAFAMAPGARAQTDAGLGRFVHPNAKALISINWGRIGHTPIGTMLREKLGAAAGSMVPGLEFLDDVDRVLISSPGSNADDNTEEAPTL